MSKKLFVYSTLANDQRYTGWIKPTAEQNPDVDAIHQVEYAVLVKGGAGVANDRFITSRGVRTEVTEEQVRELESNHVFNIHKRNGFVMIESEGDAESVADDMAEGEKSSPITETNIDTKVPAGPTVDQLETVAAAGRKVAVSPKNK